MKEFVHLHFAGGLLLLLEELPHQPPSSMLLFIFFPYRWFLHAEIRYEVVWVSVAIELKVKKERGQSTREVVHVPGRNGPGSIQPPATSLGMVSK